MAGKHSPNSKSPHLELYFDEANADNNDEDEELQPFEFDDERGGASTGAFGAAKEEDYDAINDVTFGRCELLSDRGLEALSERVSFLNAKVCCFE